MNKTAWIAPEFVVNQRNVCFQAASGFELTQLPESSTLKITAESFYYLYVNAVQVGSGPIRGSRTSCYIDSWNIAPFLRLGHNVVAVEVQCMNYPSFVAVPAEPALWVEWSKPLEWLVRLAPYWHSDTDYFSLQSGYAEWIDHRLDTTDWRNGIFSGEWRKAVPVTCDKKLIPCPLPAMRQTQYANPVPIAHAQLPPVPRLDKYVARLMTEEEWTLLPPLPQYPPWRWETSDHQWGIALIVDFEREVIGEVLIDIEAPAGTVMDLGYEEILWHGRLRADSPGDPSYNFADRHILPGRRVVVGNRFSERGFRILEIALRNFSGPVTIRRITVNDRRYPWQEATKFACSDPEITTIRERCMATLSCCTTDVLMDCPWRERAFWTNDWLVENLASLTAFGPAKVHRHLFDLLFGQCWESNGLFPGPCPGPPEGYNDGSVLISSNLYIFQILEDYVAFSGDLGVIRQHADSLWRILATFHSWSDSDGLVTPPECYWSFFDWSFERNGYSFHGLRSALLNYWYVSAMSSMSRLAEWAGLPIPDDLHKRIRHTRASLQVHFHDSATGRILDICLHNGQPEYLSSQLIHATALAFGEVETELAAEYVRALEDVTLLEPDLFLLDTVLRQMGKNGRGAAALQRIRDNWGPIVHTGAPTIWESRDGKTAFKEAGSLCHGFTAMPVTFLSEIVLGIQPLTPSFRRFRIIPESCGLTWAGGEVRTASGIIGIAWAMDSSDTMCVEVTIPPDCVGITPDGREWGEGQHMILLTPMCQCRCEPDRSMP